MASGRKLSVGSKIHWTELDVQERTVQVNAYVVGFKDNLVIVKIHGKLGKYSIPKKALLAV